ncbi:MAG: zinc metallopeptidase [Pyrinomonadaceae bacterium]|nr:zinc metallopeptidase [Pyrinomonadaceae bacterium]
MLEDERESQNIEDRRGMSGGRMAIGGGGCFTLVIALVIFIAGGNPLRYLQQQAQQDGVQVGQNQPIQTNPQEEKEKSYMQRVLATTEDAWGAILPKQAGRKYTDPVLVLYRNSTPTACGTGESGMGPFYCPGDQKLYLDMAFFDELKNEFKAPGDFAKAYVVAHEVGHHVQNLLGTMDKVQALQQRVGEVQSNQLSVRLELQADCYAGVWANYVQKNNKGIEISNIQEALRAAQAVGDDMIQRRTQGYVVPESFTHGSAKDRMTWFTNGYKTGDIRQCNTFGR